MAKSPIVFHAVNVSSEFFKTFCWGGFIDVISVGGLNCRSVRWNFSVPRANYRVSDLSDRLKYSHPFRIKLNCIIEDGVFVCVPATPQPLNRL